MDGYKSFTVSHKNTIGLNVDNKMKYTHAKHQPIKDVVGDLSNINTINLNYSNGYVYMLIVYDRTENRSLLPDGNKAGLDIGVNNLATLYVDDTETPSIIVDGTPYKTYNAQFNRLLAKLNVEIADCQNELKDTTKESLNNGLDLKGHIEYLYRLRSYLYEKRNNFFFSEFHKISVRILECLALAGVNELVISKSLSELKYLGIVSCVRM